jgi:hypothetical protein
LTREHVVVGRALLSVFCGSVFTAAGSVASGMAHVEYDWHWGVMASASAVECDIRSKVDAGGLQLEAIARSNEKVRGEYVFTVLKQSSSGTTQSQQSGDFAIERRGDVVLTTVVLEVAARGHYQANLSITWDHGRVACQSPEAPDRT